MHSIMPFSKITVECHVPDGKVLKVSVGKFARVESVLRSVLKEWMGSDKDFRNFHLAVDDNTPLTVSFCQLCKAHPKIEETLQAGENAIALLLQSKDGTFRSVSSVRSVQVPETQAQKARREAREAKQREEAKALAAKRRKQALPPQALLMESQEWQDRMKRLDQKIEKAFQSLSTCLEKPTLEENSAEVNHLPKEGCSSSELLVNISDQLEKSKPSRMLAHLSLDKPTYRPGETIYARAIVLDAHTNAIQLFTHSSYLCVFEIRNARNEVIFSRSNQMSTSACWAPLPIPGDTPGGEYFVLIKLCQASTILYSTQRNFDIWQQQELSPLRMQLDFMRKGLSTNDLARAKLSVIRREGGQVSESSKVEAIAQMDGQEFFRDQVPLTDQGQAMIQFRLPQTFSSAQGSLTVTVEDEGTVGSITRTLPLILDTLDVRAYAESGDLVAGLSTRLYFEAFTPNGEPADFEGVLIELSEKEYQEELKKQGKIQASKPSSSEKGDDTKTEKVETKEEFGASHDASSMDRDTENEDFASWTSFQWNLQVDTDAASSQVPSSAVDSASATPPPLGMKKLGREVDQVHTLHEGRGFVPLVPQLGSRYALRVFIPSGIRRLVLFPALSVRERGVTIRALQDVYHGNKPLEVKISSSYEGEFLVCVCKKEKEIAYTQIQMSGNCHPYEKTVQFSLPRKSGLGTGILRVTVFDVHTAQPLAERLVYRQPTQHIQIQIFSDKKDYKPRDWVTIRYRTVDENGKPIGALSLVTVTDDAILESIQTRKQAPRLPQMALLEHEVNKLHDCLVYLPQYDPRPESERLNAIHSVRYEDESFSQTESENKKATPGCALDLLLATQGWRRFIFYKNAADPFFDNADHAAFRSVLAVDQVENSKLDYHYWWHPSLIYFNLPYFRPLLYRHPHYSRLNHTAMAMPAASNVDAAFAYDELLDFSESDGSESDDDKKTQSISFGGPNTRNGGLRCRRARGGPPRGGGRGSGMRKGGRGGKAWKSKDKKGAKKDKSFFGGMPPPPPSSGSPPLSSALPPPPAPGAPPMLSCSRSSSFVAEKSPKLGEKLKKKKCASRRRKPASRSSSRLLSSLSYQVSRPYHQSYAREYAHPAPTREEFDAADHALRNDFTETVYCNAAHCTDARGIGQFQFWLSHSITSFRVRIDAVSDKNCFGSADFMIVSKKPVSIAPQVPIQMTVGDVVALPIVLVNRIDEEICLSLKFSSKALAPVKTIEEEESEFDKHTPFTLDRILIPPQARPSISPCMIAGSAGISKFHIEVLDKERSISDSWTRNVPVKARGFPVYFHKAGTCSISQGSLQHDIQLHEGAMIGAIATELRFFPKANTTLVASFEHLIRTPHGCFEQICATMWPMMLAARYYASQSYDATQPASNGKGPTFDPSRDDPAKVATIQDKLKDGYQKLMRYQSKDKGFEWYGASPSHGALTAYGLITLLELNAVSGEELGECMVAPTVIGGIAKSLMARRDGHGRFTQTPGKYQFARPDRTTADAYITYALAKAGCKTLDQELAFLQSVFEKGERDSYVSALTLLAYMHVDREKHLEKGHSIAARLCMAQHEKTGCVEGGRSSITRSGRLSTDLETTALVVMGWHLLDRKKYADAIAEGLKYLNSKRRLGRYGSTQGTALALQALMVASVDEDEEEASPCVCVELNGSVVAEKEIVPGALCEIPSFAEALQLKGASNALKITVKGTHRTVPYALAVRYYTTQPDSHEKCAVCISTQLASAGSAVPVGETTVMQVGIKNVRDNPLPMVLAVIGIPGGAEVGRVQLKQAVKSGLIDYFEVHGARLHLYLRGMHPAEDKKIQVLLQAKVGGSYTGTASFASLYYTPHKQHWTPGCVLKIQPQPDTVVIQEISPSEPDGNEDDEKIQANEDKDSSC